VLKVLFATIPQPANRFVRDLKEGMEKHAEVIWDYEEFWKCQNHYDVVHLHEPEYLSYEIEGCMNNSDPIPEDLWNRLIRCFEHWSKHSTIIHTRHVQEPHVRIDDEFRKLYRVTMSYCHGVAHFAGFSIRQFAAFYPELDQIRHEVIPHHNYTSLPNETTRKEARGKLNIDEDAKVMLVFGTIKEHEKELVRIAFDAIPGSNKVLLAPGWKIPRRKIGYIRLREWVFRLDMWRAARNKRFRVNLGFVKEEEAQYFCHASDFLLIPRTNELNSGNITFGFTFGLVVVGKDSANIGEILMETGNPVFEPGNRESVENAVREAIQLANDGHGAKNQELALSMWGVDEIEFQYIDLYQNAKSISKPVGR
jgi:hypothetical protein